MEYALHEQTGSRRLVAGWLLLALIALALSTLCALLLIAARTPLAGTIAASSELFGRALVLHVSLAVVVWFLACAAGIWTLAAGPAAGTLRWTALGLAGAGMVAMVMPLFFGAAQPVLANYIPALDHPVFLAGLILFIAGVALCGVTALRDMARRLNEGPVWRLGALLSMLAAGVALAASIVTFIKAGAPQGAPGFELLAWSPGHVLQFVHVLLLMSVWTVLGESVLGQPVAPRRWLAALLLLAAAPLLAVPFIYFSYPVGSAEFRWAFTLLMALGSWPAAAALALRLLLQLRRAGRAMLAAPQGPALLLSILLFLLGCALGALIRNDSTMVPAHYHGTVGAVTLAYMALGYRLLPLFGAAVRDSAAPRLQPLLYGSGLLLLALALAWSGALGVPRKTLHADVIVQYPAYFAAMGLAGLGGMLAIGGAAFFVVNVLRSLGNGRLPPSRRGRRDVRWPAFALTLGLTGAIGMLLAYWPADNGGIATAANVDPRKDAAGHVAQTRSEEVQRRCTEGVALLNAKQYEAAASELHRVLALAPKMPEAHVNMGFAMIGLQQYAMARDFFDAAIELRTTQMNAYYGLAVALEGLGDLPGALGAMRTYVHRGQADDPFLRKANAAIWEWEDQIAKSRINNPPQTAAIPENGKGGIRYPITEKKLN